MNKFPYYLLIVGEIGHMTYVKFKANLLKAQMSGNPSIVVCIDTHGGCYASSWKIARLIRLFGLKTHIVGQCMSGGVIIFLAGIRRSSAPNTDFGVHQVSFTRDDGIQVRNDHLSDVFKSQIARFNIWEQDKLDDAFSKDDCTFIDHDDAVKCGIFNDGIEEIELSNLTLLCYDPNRALNDNS